MTNINGLRTPEWKDQKVDFSKWSTGFDALSEDPLGISVFESFLHTEGYLQYLEFLWACEGMRNIGHKQRALVPQIVNCIYRHYILSGVLHNSATEPILNSLRKSMGNNGSEHPFSCNEMEDMLNDLKIHIDFYLRNEIYPKFLKSSIFLEAEKQYSQPSIGESCSPKAIETNTADCEPKLSGVKLKDSTLVGPNLYRRKIIFVLNNDDLPTHQTLITTSGNSKHAHDPESFVKELTEKLERLKLQQEREEENFNKVEAAYEAERVNQKIFCSKITEALNEHIGKEGGNKAASANCSSFNTEAATKKHEGQIKGQNAEKIHFSCHKRRIKSCLQHFTLFKSTKKFRAKFQKCGRYSINCMRQKDNHGPQVSKFLTKSRSLNFSDSEPELSEASHPFPDTNKKQHREGVVHSSSFPSRIQNWMNDGKADI